MPTIPGSIAFGYTTSVNAPNAIALGVDGNVNLHEDSGVVRIYGDLEVTGDAPELSYDVSTDLDSLGT